MTEPNGVRNKFVLWHPESSSYMYAHSEDERDTLLLDGLLSNVTGEPMHEAAAEAQLGPWQIDANEVADEALVLAGGTLETTEGTIALVGDIAHIPEAIYDRHKDEIDALLQPGADHE